MFNKKWNKIDNPDAQDTLTKDGHDLWYKRDDTYEQPLILINGRILMKTDEFPKTVMGSVKFTLFTKILNF